MHSRDNAIIREVNRIFLSFLRKYGLPGITVYISEGMGRNNSGTDTRNTSDNTLALAIGSRTKGFKV